jgi:hypothetical protein
LPPEERKLYLYEQKLRFEIKMGSKAMTKEYERVRLEVIAEPEIVALEGFCNECGQLNELSNYRIFGYELFLLHFDHKPLLRQHQHREKIVRKGKMRLDFAEYFGFPFVGLLWNI